MSKWQSFGFVVNPHAGRKKAAAWRAEIAQALDSAGIGHEIVETGSVATVEGRVKDLSGRHDVVFAVGGDGTAHHVAQGLIGGKTPFGLLPNGSGNDYSRMIGMPRGVSSGLDLLLRGSTIRSYNAMQLEVYEQDSKVPLRRWSINTAGYGFDAAVSDIKTRVPLLKGIALYLTSSLVTLVTYRATSLQVGVERPDDFRGLMVAAGLGEFEGGGFRIFPGASGVSDSFHVCEVREDNKLRALPLLLKAVKGGHTKSNKISMSQTRETRFASGTPIPVHADGEVLSLEAVEVRIRLAQKALNVLVPAP